MYKRSGGGEDGVIYIGRKLSVGIMGNGDSLIPGVESACEAREPCRGLVLPVITAQRMVLYGVCAAIHIEITE